MGPERAAERGGARRRRGVCTAQLAPAIVFTFCPASATSRASVWVHMRPDGGADDVDGARDEGDFDDESDARAAASATGGAVRASPDGPLVPVQVAENASPTIANRSIAPPRRHATWEPGIGS